MAGCRVGFGMVALVCGALACGDNDGNGTGGSSSSSSSSGGGALLLPGAACTAGAQCQSGFCVDGACCDTACTGTCLSCARGMDGAGRCSPVHDGEDPREDCAGECSACYGAACAPVLVGTDPGGACGAGRTCSAASQCAAAYGAACGNGGDCALGECVDLGGGHCLGEYAVDTLIAPLDPVSHERRVMAVALTAAEEPVVLLHEETREQNTITSQKWVLWGRHAGVEWHTLLADGSFAADVAALGSQPVVVMAGILGADACPADDHLGGGRRCEVHALFRGPAGEPGAVESIWDPTTVTDRRACQVRAAASSDGRLLVAVATVTGFSCFGSADWEVSAFERSAAGTWSRLGENPLLTLVNHLVTVGYVGGEPYVMDVPSTPADAFRGQRAAAGSSAQVYISPAGCGAVRGLPLVLADEVRIGGSCSAANGAALLRYRPADATPWTRVDNLWTDQAAALPLGEAAGLHRLVRTGYAGPALAFADGTATAAGPLLHQVDAAASYTTSAVSVRGGRALLGAAETREVDVGGSTPETLLHQPFIVELRH
ncbi:MAG: hypothetical protein HY904_26415 [Deltaproteobacteria bacterium]|nr:hypothetical protein [Deltaproteobacteria bacterium]